MLRVTDNKDEESLLTMKQASQLLHVHENTLRRWSNKGLLRTYRAGIRHHRMFRIEDLATMLSEERK